MAFLALRMVATHVENLNKSENLKIKVIEEKIKKCILACGVLTYHA